MAAARRICGKDGNPRRAGKTSGRNDNVGQKRLQGCVSGPKEHSKGMMIMSKRGNNEGSIYKREDGRWAAALSLLRGKRRTLYGKTRQEVAGKLAAAIRDRDTGVAMIPQRQSVGQFLERWLETARPSLRPRTYRRYEEYVRLHAVPSIGHIRLSQLSPQHLQELYAQRLRDGLSPTSVAHLHAV